MGPKKEIEEGYPIFMVNIIIIIRIICQNVWSNIFKIVKNDNSSKDYILVGVLLLRSKFQ